MKKEKVIFETLEDKKIVGILHLPEENTKKIIIFSHGFTSNKDRENINIIGDALAEKGYAFLRFDFGGSGESYDTEITIKNQIKDLQSAILFAKKKGYVKICLMGASLGGLVSIENYNSYISTMILLAPNTKNRNNLQESLLDYGYDEKELRNKGYVIKMREKEFKIPLEYFHERININPQNMLPKINCPVLILHGDKDTYVPLEDSKDAIKLLPNSKLEIIKGEEHRFNLKLRETIPLIINWVTKNLK